MERTSLCQYKPWSRCRSPCVRVRRYTTRRDVQRRRYCREPPGALKWRQGGFRPVAGAAASEKAGELEGEEAEEREKQSEPAESFEPAPALELPQEPVTPTAPVAPAIPRPPAGRLQRRASQFREAPVISDADFTGFLDDVIADPTVCFEAPPPFLRAVVRRLIAERLATRQELPNSNDAVTLCPALHRVAVRVRVQER